MNARCCNDFSRSQLLRQGAAMAGRGLPAIEPGMPLPAGTGLSRRSFMVRSLGMALSVYGASKLGIAALEEGIAQAAAGPTRPILVSIFMEGGADSLSVLAPVGDPKYAGLRPTLAQPVGNGPAFAEDTRLQWHPSARGLATLHGEGKVNVLPAVGYDHPSSSHFTSRHFWEVGALDVNGRLGWLGRYLDTVGAPDNPLQGLSLSGSLSPALAASAVPVAAVSQPGTYTFTSPGVGAPIDAQMLQAFGAVGSLGADSPALAQARRAQANAARLRQQLQPFAGTAGGTGYPSGIMGQRLAALAAMIAAGLPLQSVTLSAVGGYDTHAGQAGALSSNLKATADTVLAFQRDLEARGIADRVLIELWSEFGRRPQENGSAGTDHGAAGTAFIIGTRARGQMIGEFPGLANLDSGGNLRATADFRALYCSLLEQWFGADPSAIIPGASGFARPALLKP